MWKGNNVITMRSLREDLHSHKVTESIFKNRKKTQPEHRYLKKRRGELEYRRSRKTMRDSHRKKQRKLTEGEGSKKFSKSEL